MSSILDALRRAQQATSGSAEPGKDAVVEHVDGSRAAAGEAPADRGRQKETAPPAPPARSTTSDEELSTRSALDRETEYLARKLAERMPVQDPDVRAAAVPDAAAPADVEAVSDPILGGGDGESGAEGAPGGASGPPPRRSPGLLKVAVVVLLGLGLGAAASRLLLPGASDSPSLDEQVEVARESEPPPGDEAAAASADASAQAGQPSLKPNETGKRRPPLLAPGSPKHGGQKREGAPTGDKPDRQARAAGKMAAKAGEAEPGRELPKEAPEGGAEATGKAAKPTPRDPFASSAKPAGLDEAEPEGAAGPAAQKAEQQAEQPAEQPGEPAPPASPSEPVRVASKTPKPGIAAVESEPEVAPAQAPPAAGAKAGAPVPPAGAVPAPIALGSKPATPAPPVEPIVVPDDSALEEPDALVESSDAEEEADEEAALELASAPPPPSEVLDKPPPGAPEVILLFIQWSSFPERRVASFRGPGGRLLIVHEGDIVEGMKVIEIGQATVEFQWRGNAFRVYAGRSAPTS